MTAGFFSSFRGKTGVSITEQRQLITLKSPTFQSFLDQTFQTNLEETLADQFPMSGKIKNFASTILQFADYKKIPSFFCRNRYVYVNDSYAVYDCSDYLVGMSEPDEEFFANFQNHLKYYNVLNSIADTYYYVLENSSSYDFENHRLVIDAYSLLKENLQGDYHLGKFQHNTFEEYQKYFYKSDHHWNLYGSYLGYTEIMKLLKPEDEVLTPEGIRIISKYPFYGSVAKQTRQWNFGEVFQYYEFSLPEHEEYIDGKLKNYGNYNPKDEDIKAYDNYYALVYGGDEAEIFYDFKKDEKENLLILASSYSNPINRLIASHFNHTYVLDLRHSSVSDFRQYVEEHDIDKILVLASPEFLFNARFNR